MFTEVKVEYMRPFTCLRSQIFQFVSRMLSRHEVPRVIIALSCSQQMSLEPEFQHPVASTG